MLQTRIGGLGAFLIVAMIGGAVARESHSTPAPDAGTASRASQLIAEGRQLVARYEEMMIQVNAMKTRGVVEAQPIAATRHALSGPPAAAESWQEQRLHLLRADAGRVWKQAIACFREAGELGGNEFRGDESALADAYFCRFADCAASGKVATEAFRKHVKRYDIGGRYASELGRGGTLSLTTDPPGAEVYIYRYEARGYRLVPLPFDPRSDSIPASLKIENTAEDYDPNEEARLTINSFLDTFESWNRLGKTPLVNQPLPTGSYLLVIRAPGRMDIRYPLLIRRAQDASPANPIRHYAVDEFPQGDDWIQVPCGRSILGGDTLAFDAWTRRETDISSFFISRFEVSCARYLEFLNSPAIVDEYRQALAKDELRFIPRFDDRTPQQGWSFNSTSGRFSMESSWRDRPVLSVSWTDARRYVRWRNEQAEREGSRWRYSLPTEEQWERAARGADGRDLPWGKGFRWTYCLGAQSQPLTTEPEARGAYLVDESPFGVRDLAGSVREWCADRLAADSDLRSLRGGAWGYGRARYFRSAYRVGEDPRFPSALFGFRLVCKDVRSDQS